jgi:hypothetical protein
MFIREVQAPDGVLESKKCEGFGKFGFMANAPLPR